jgi:hypothetical protein
VLTDEQWKHVAYRSKLPLEARYNIDNIIGLYRQQVADAETKYPDIWKKLEVAKQSAAEALDRLEAVLSDPNAFAAIAMGIDGRREVPPQKLAAFRSWLEQQRKELQALVSGYDNAMERVHNRKRGPRTGRDSLLTLVALLNQLHEAYTGKKISRSGNRTNTSIEFVWDVCQIANSNLKRPTVDDAVKQVITDEGEGDFGGIIGSVELIPAAGGQVQHKLHIEKNCSFMPIFHPIPGSSSIRMSKSKDPCRDGIHWRILPWQD